MIIQVLKIRKETVLFSSEYGTALGYWKDRVKAKEKKYSVEFDYPGVIDCQQIIFSNSNCAEINMVGDIIEITGKVVECKENFLSLQLGGSFIDFETKGEIQDIFNKYITVSLEKINLYDEHIF